MALKTRKLYHTEAGRDLSFDGGDGATGVMEVMEAMEVMEVMEVNR